MLCISFLFQKPLRVIVKKERYIKKAIQRKKVHQRKKRKKAIQRKKRKKRKIDL
jgi:hypothetical protein